MSNINKALNPYQQHIETFFSRIVELQHTANQITSTLRKSVISYESLKSSYFISYAALVISDWTGPTDNGWVIKYHTGKSRTIHRKDYAVEVERMISNECCYAFAQSFEALETFIKDCVFTKTQRDKDYLDYVISKSKKVVDRSTFHRTLLPGGDALFNLMKIAASPHYVKNSKRNNMNIKFKEFWTVLSEARHSVVHSSSNLELPKIKKTDYHFHLFESFFSYSHAEEEKVLIELGIEKLDKLLKAISEFSFQIFKMLSAKEALDWEILKK